MSTIWVDEVEAVEELQDFFVGPEIYCREPCLPADVVGVGYSVGLAACRQVRDAQEPPGVIRSRNSRKIPSGSSSSWMTSSTLKMTTRTCC